jgi:hypothetical protein
MASTAKRLSKFSRKKLLGLVKDDMGYTDDDFDFGSITKPELIEIALNHMGSDSIPSKYSKGGLTTNHTDYRKSGMFK